MTPKYTITDVGCYIDGASGHSDHRHQLASMIEDYNAVLANELRDGNWQNWPDDLSDEDDAIELLDAHTDEGLYWFCEAGGLFLTESE